MHSTKSRIELATAIISLIAALISAAVITVNAIQVNSSNSTVYENCTFNQCEIN